MGKSELARHLDVPPKERALLRGILRELLCEGVIEERRGGRFGPAGGRPGVARGEFSVDFRGRPSVRLISGGGAVPANENGIRIVPVAAEGTGTALPGDSVEVGLRRREPEVWRRYRGRAWDAEQEEVWEARVIKVVTPGRRATSGVFREAKGRTRPMVEPDDSRYPKRVEAVEVAKGCRPQGGDLVLVEILRWDHAGKPPQARVVRVLGGPGSPGNDVLALMHRYDLSMDFPGDVHREAEAMPEKVCADDLDGREDWRDRAVFTIDPFDAKDFDDAIHVEKREKGWRLAVHIADVSHYVKPGSPLDKEARRRGNSTYLVDRVIPMLPENLSNGLCSLVPGQDRLTRMAVIDFDGRGRVTQARFGSAVIHSARRYTYEEAFAVLQGAPRKGDETEEMLHEAWRLASRLRRNRFAKGGLDLDFPEIKVVLDSRGKVAELRRIEYDISHQLIEEFMLAANEAVAAAIRHAGVPCIFRVHDDPDTDRLFEFREMAKIFGLSSGDLTVRAELQKLLQKIKGHPEEHPLKLGLLKSLKRAVYAAEPRGHFGLAKENYLHFTSPIRRYADLVAHRVLGGLPAHQPVLRCATPRQSEMEEIGGHLSRTERASADAEIESRQMKIMEYFEQMLNMRERPDLRAVIVDARRSGLFVELEDAQIKGLVPREALPGDGWWFDGERMRWLRERPRMELRPGMEVTVRIAGVDAEKRFLDFSLVTSPNEKVQAGRVRRKTKSAPNEKSGGRKNTRRSTAKKESPRNSRNKVKNGDNQDSPSGKKNPTTRKKKIGCSAKNVKKEARNVAKRKRKGG